jgi:sulfatase modifying factor 1
MRKILSVIFTSLVIISCGGGSSGGANKASSSSTERGQILSRGKTKNFTPLKPYGMVPIPGGHFVLGQTDIDFVGATDAQPKTVTVSGFYMDDTEVTNAEYNNFVSYVRDSVARTALADRAYELGTAGEEGIGEYAYLGEDESEEDGSAWQQYLKENKTGREGGRSDYQRLNWDVNLSWSTEDYPDVAYAEVMEGLYYPPVERFNGERLFDVRKLNYRYTWVNTQSAASSKGQSRSDFVVTEEINIYPDTTVWSRDFNYTYNEPMHEHYFWHEAYYEYPVVGVDWEQAQAFCTYKTKTQRDYLANKKGKEKNKVFAYRLPTEVEWEFAARGGLEAAAYPWGGPYLTDDRGCHLANFKPKRGNYRENCSEKDGGYLYSAKTQTFPPNGYGLYDMSGNVSEWTSSPYEYSAYNAISSANPSLGRGTGYSKKSVRGGSWKDVGFLLMVGSRDWEHKDSARSFIGFRTVQTIPEGSNVIYKKIKK